MKRISRNILLKTTVIFYRSLYCYNAGQELKSHFFKLGLPVTLYVHCVVGGSVGGSGFGFVKAYTSILEVK